MEITKDYLNEESCIFQLISNKKAEFLNYFDFFIQLPGFTSIYKDKFFSKIKDFIYDKNYIFNLKQKYTQKCEKHEDNAKNDYLGFKRKRFKEDKIGNDAYDDELKLLENDYPQIIENDEMVIENVKIKKEKISEADEEINNEINDLEKDITNDTYYENKDINIKGQKEKENDINKGQIPLNFKINNNKSQKNNKAKKISKDKIINNNKLNKLSLQSPKGSKIRRKRYKLKSIKKSLINNYSPLNSSNDNTTNNENAYFNNRVTNKKYNDNALSMLNGINSRLDKMPKINVFKKKKRLTNFSAGKLKENIQEQLSIIDSKVSKQSSEKLRFLSDDRLRMKKLNKYVNKNFYGKERLKSPSFFTSDSSPDRNIENNPNIIHNKIEIYNCDIKDMDSTNKNNNSNNNYNNVVKNKKISKNESSLLETPKFYENKGNKNVKVLNKIILCYTIDKKKGEKIITKAEFIPYSIIIDKNAFDSGEIKSLNDSLFQKKSIQKNEDLNNKNNIPQKINITNEKIKIKIRKKKSRIVPVVKSQKNNNITIKPRRSSRIQYLRIKKNEELINNARRIRKKFSKRRSSRIANALSIKSKIKENNNKKEDKKFVKKDEHKMIRKEEKKLVKEEEKKIIKKEVSKAIKKEEKKVVKKGLNKLLKKEEKKVTNKEEKKIIKTEVKKDKKIEEKKKEINEEKKMEKEKVSLGLSTIKSNFDKKLVNELNFNNEEILVMKTNNIDFDDINMEEMLKGFNYLYNQK